MFSFLLFFFSSFLLFFFFYLNFLLNVYSTPLRTLLSSLLLSSALLSLVSLPFHPTPLLHMHAHTGLLQLIDVSST